MLNFQCKVSPVILHGVVSPEIWGVGFGMNVGDVGALDHELHLELDGHGPRRAFLHELVNLRCREALQGSFRGPGWGPVQYRGTPLIGNLPFNTGVPRS